MRLTTEYIVTKGLGSLHFFGGDGFMATFGDHLVPIPGRDENHAIGSSALALFVAERVSRGFQQLHEAWRLDSRMRSFDYKYNEDVQLRLGTGISYGEVHFDEFGVPRSRAEDDDLGSGFLTYTPVGDHVNVAARLCGIAHQEIGSIDILERPTSVVNQHPRAPEYLAPIVTTKPAALSQAAGDRLYPEPVFTTVTLKGVGHRIPVLEIWPQEARDVPRFKHWDVARILLGAISDEFYANKVEEAGKDDEIIEKHKNRLNDDLKNLDS
jgi:hypothetical protein